MYSGWTGDACPVDANGDGWPDLYVTNMQGDDAYYENAGGTAFLDKSRVVFPKTPWGSTGIAVFDFNNDGRSDVLVTDMHSDMYETVGPEREKLKPREPHCRSRFSRRKGGACSGTPSSRTRGAGPSMRWPTGRGWRHSGPGALASGTLTPTGSRTSSSPAG